MVCHPDPSLKDVEETLLHQGGNAHAVQCAALTRGLPFGAGLKVTGGGSAPCLSLAETHASSSQLLPAAMAGCLDGLQETSCSRTQLGALDWLT
jgi:hypothetical protein